MTWTVVIACWLQLFRVDVQMMFFGYAAIRANVQKMPVDETKRDSLSVESVCDAIARAGIFYFRTISPLHRATATAAMLRSHGWPAEVVIGLRILPIDSYAWVEISRQIVNERGGAMETYQVLDRY